MTPLQLAKALRASHQLVVSDSPMNHRRLISWAVVTTRKITYKTIYLRWNNEQANGPETIIREISWRELLRLIKRSELLDVVEESKRYHNWYWGK